MNDSEDKRSLVTLPEDENYPNHSQNNLKITSEPEGVDTVDGIRHSTANHNDSRLQGSIPTDKTDGPAELIATLGSQPTHIDGFLQTLQNISKPLSTLLVIVLVLGAEKLTQDKLFKCPCKASHQNVLYSILFLVVPAVVLFCISVGLNTLTWRAVTGCCRRSGQARYGVRGWCNVACALLPPCVLAPYVWIVCAFFNGSIYECLYMIGDICDDRTRTEWQLKALIPDQHTKSQLIGMGLLMLGVVVGFIYVCVQQARSVHPYEWEKFSKMYEEEYEKQREYVYRELSKGKAQRVMRDFAERTYPECHIEFPSESSDDEGEVTDAEMEGVEMTSPAARDTKLSKTRSKRSFRPLLRENSREGWENISRPGIVEFIKNKSTEKK